MRIELTPQAISELVDEIAQLTRERDELAAALDRAAAEFGATGKLCRINQRQTHYLQGVDGVSEDKRTPSRKALDEHDWDAKRLAHTVSRLEQENYELRGELEQMVTEVLEAGSLLAAHLAVQKYLVVTQIEQIDDARIDEEESIARSSLSTLVDKFNRAFPVGTHVRYRPVLGGVEVRNTKTRSAAYVLSSHTAVVFIEEQAGCVALTHVEPLAAAPESQP